MNLAGWARVVGVLATITSPVWVSHWVWRVSPAVSARVLPVNYTVPPGNYLAHSGLTWVLNHRKISGHFWRSDRDFIGYRPEREGGPVRIEQADLSQFDWVFVIDTYGVYEQDLLDPRGRAGPAPPSRLVFGGLSSGDMDALEAFTAGGGDVLVEFNVLGPPTRTLERDRIEALLGVTWTGWVGRYFDDLTDPLEQPYWFPTLFRSQYPDRPIPTTPTLLLVDEEGTMILVGGDTIESVAPVIETTDASRAALGRVSVPFYGWFSVVDAPGAEVFAELVLPDDAALRGVVPLRSPMLTRRADETSRRIYLSGNLSHIDFNPGQYALAGIARVQAVLHRRRDFVGAQPAYWQFYVPAVTWAVGQDTPP